MTFLVELFFVCNPPHHSLLKLGTERTTIMTPEVLNRTAYHEGGHAVVSLFIEGCSPIYKATIVPRGQTLGVVRNY